MENKLEVNRKKMYEQVRNYFRKLSQTVLQNNLFGVDD